MRFLPRLQVSPAQFEERSRRINLVMLLLIGLALTSLVLEYGFYFSDSYEQVFRIVDLVVLFAFMVQQMFKLLIAPDRWAYLSARRVEYLLTFSLLLAVALYPLLISSYEALPERWRVGSLTSVYIVLAQSVILADIIFGAVRMSRRLSSLHIQPARIFIASFVLVILTGTVALLLPRATVHGISATDALFTSTSAVCVTGLIVVDTATAFTPFGQIVILMLIQIGGLGLMTFTTFFTLFSGRLSIKERVLMQEMLNRESLGEVRQTLRNIIAVTLLIELIGAVFLYYSWGDVAFGSERAKIFSSLFHSVSAFCNAGFSLFSDNLAVSGAAMNVQLNLVITSLIILGGLGFIAIVNVVRVRPWGRPGSRLRYRLTAHTRLVLASSGILIAAGMLLFYFIEYNNTLHTLSWWEKILASFFQSVTTRTAGFNTTDIGGMAVPSTLLFLVLMFIGASPGSTGGGIKTTTASLVFLSAMNHVRGKPAVSIAKRRVQPASIERAYAALLFGLGLIVLTVFLLSFFEPFPLLDITFEAVSAAATVGLSRGITFALTDASKIILVFTMLIGRVGTLTMMMALTRRAPLSRYDYPTEQIVVG
ncbi:TrkH family potassium uptake protein [bacterium]|nr:TrkH family potassium uptake protein [bacterium]